MPTRRLALIVLLAAAGVSSPAEAASRAAKNRCNDAVMILRSNPGKAYEREDVDPLDTRNAGRHRAQVVDGITRAKAKLDQVPAGELDEHDGELAECFAEVRAWADYLKLLDGKIARAEELGKVYVPFLAAVKSHQRAFISFLSIAADPATRALDNLKPDDLKTALAAMGEVEQTCAGLAAEHQEPPADYDGKLPPAKLVQRPFAWCRLAKRRVELATAYLANKQFHAEGYGAYGIEIPEDIEKLEANQGNVSAWVAEIVFDPKAFRAALRASAEAWYRAAGVAMPANPAPGVDELIAKLVARIDAVAPTQHWVKGPRSPDVERRAQASLLKIYPKAKVVAFAMDADNFTITKTRVGLPTDRFRSGQILFKLPATKHCLQRAFSYVETYQGGGRYQQPGTIKILGAVRFLSCK